MTRGRASPTADCIPESFFLADCAGCHLKTAALSRVRGSQHSFLHALRERYPLDDLACVSVTALRFVRYPPARSSPRSPAMPDAGPLNAMK